MKRLLFVVGIAFGYVVGARAGRPAYDAVAERFRGVAQNPSVVHAGETAKKTLEDKAPKVADVVEKVASTASGAAAAANDAGSEASTATPAPSDASPDPAV